MSPKKEELLDHELTQQQIPYQISLKRPRVRRPLYFLETVTRRLEEEKALAKVTKTKGQPPATRLGSTRPSLFFGEWCPCKVWQQEPRLLTAVLPEKNIQITKEGRATGTGNSREQQTLKYAHMINLQLINSVLLSISSMSGLSKVG